ncbi:MAG: hypothetical protein ACI38U_01970 [Corynebacterium sp.]|uniref:hypothetical protein n=1 Tax=Corynebacterium sp. TaxID=1720 RepID=UPI003F003E95
MLSTIFDALTGLITSSLGDLAGRSAHIRLRWRAGGRGTGDVAAIAESLARNPADVWPGRVARAEVTDVDDGVRVTWRRIRRNGPSWDNYVRDTTRALTNRYPGSTSTSTESVGRR